MERVINSSVDELYVVKFFYIKKMERRNNFFVVSMFNRGCWGSRNNFFIKWIIGFREGFSKGTALGRFT